MTRNVRRSQMGAATTEYTLLLVAMAFMLVGIVRLLGIDTAVIFCRVAQGIGVETLCATDDVLFSDDFSDGVGQWDFDMGANWENKEEALCAQGGGEHRAYGLGSEAEDFTISFDATLLSGNGYGVFFRAEGDRITGYTFQYDPGYRGGQFIIRKWVDGYEIWPPFAASRAPDGFEWYDVERRVVVDAHGDTFTVKIDGDTVVQGRDDTYTNGRVGLRVWTPSEACFDNIQVKVR